MSSFWAAVHLALFIFWLLVVARVIVETTRSFARSWRPTGATAVGLEIVFVVTDPPIRLLRRALPPLDIGGRPLDLSVLVLFICIWVAQVLVYQLITVS